MLVKVRNDDPSRLSSTERTVVNWLKSWTGSHALPGIAVVQARGADLVVWTPKTCVVVAIKGFTERVNGTLTVSDTAPWTIDGHVAPLEDVQTGSEPMAEVRARTTEIERILRAAPGREHVAVVGVVLVIPQLGTRVTLEKSMLPPGLDVVVGDGPSSLRGYFARITGAADPTGAAPDPAPTMAPVGPDSWDAAQVAQGLGALGFAAAATYSDLIAEGFPPPRAEGAARRAGTETSRDPAPGAPIPAAAPSASSTARSGPPPAPAHARASVSHPAGSPAAPDAASAGRRSTPNREFATASAGYTASSGYAAPPPPLTTPASGTPPRESPATAPGYDRRGYDTGQGATRPPAPSPAQPYAVPFDPQPPKPPRSRRRSLVPLILLAILVLVLAVAALCTAGGGDTPSAPAPKPATTAPKPPATTAPGPAATAPAPGPAVPPEVPLPAQPPPPACFPFQPDCSAQ